MRPWERKKVHCSLCHGTGVWNQPDEPGIRCPKCHPIREKPAAAWYIEQCKQNVEQALAEYEAAINAAEIWLQAYRARQRGYQGYDEIEMCKEVED